MNETRKLKPPKNLRDTTPRVCASCRWFWEKLPDNSRPDKSVIVGCFRLPEIEFDFDGSNENQYFMVCDYWNDFD